MSRRPAPLLVVAGLLALVACGAPEGRSLPAPSSTSPTTPETSTTRADFSTVPLAAVPGETTTTFVTSGDAVLAGVVGGPDGAVPGAIVRAERLVGDGVQPFEVRAGEDGAWRLEELPGGRYRVRAYLPPRLTMDEPELFYLRDDETRDVPLTVRSFTGMEVLAGTTPDVVLVGDPVNLAVRVTERVVDDQGVGRLVPISDLPVQVRSIGWKEVDEPEGITDQDGMVVFTFECDRVTPVTATAVVGPDRRQFPLDVPDCGPQPTTTTTTTTTTTSSSSSSPSSSSTSTSTTTTSSPGNTGSTTTTTEDD